MSDRSKSFVWGLLTGVSITVAAIAGFIAYAAYTWPGH